VKTLKTENRNMIKTFKGLRGTATLYLGDCLEILPMLDGVDAVISDPPYGMSLDTDNSRFSGGNAASVSRRGNGIGTGEGLGIIGDAEPFDPSPWLHFVRVVLFGCNHFAARLPVGTSLVWIKRNDDAFGSFLSDAEIAWMKGGHGVYCKRDFSMNAEAKTREHPCQKPATLMSWCMDKAKVPIGATVLDPYMGSGTTGIACLRTGRNFIGIEIEPKHFQTACERMAREIDGELL
jgi:DNA modification methylase